MLSILAKYQNIVRLMATPEVRFSSCRVNVVCVYPRVPHVQARPLCIVYRSREGCGKTFSIFSIYYLSTLGMVSMSLLIHGVRGGG